MIWHYNKRECVCLVKYFCSNEFTDNKPTENEIREEWLPAMSDRCHQIDLAGQGATSFA